MNTPETDKNYKIQLLIQNIKEIKKFHHIFEKQIKEMPDSAEVALQGQYVALTSPIKEKRQIIRKYCTLLIKHNNLTYFIWRLPDKYQTREELIRILTQSNIQILRRLTVKPLPLLIVFTRKDVNIPQKWADRIAPLKKELYTPIKATFYKPPEIPFYYIPNRAKSIDDFIKSYSFLTTPYKFYTYLTYMHIAYHSGIIGQTTISDVIATSKDIRKLLPQNLTLRTFLNLLTSKRAEKKGKNIVFHFDTITLYEKNYSDDKKIQSIRPPMILLKNIFSSKAFSKNGVRYVLIILYTYHLFRIRVMHLKPSTITKLAHLNTKKGIKYLHNAIIKPLQYLKEKKLITYATPDLSEITPADIKQDKPIKCFFRAFDVWLEIQGLIKREKIKNLNEIPIEETEEDFEDEEETETFYNNDDEEDDFDEDEYE